MHHVLTFHKPYTHAILFLGGWGGTSQFLQFLYLFIWFKTTWKNSIHERINPLPIFCVLNIICECCWEKKKSHNLKIWFQSLDVPSVSSMFHCCCLSVNFYSDQVRLSPVFLNLWTPSTPISFYFLFRVKPFIFVLDLFPYCLFCDLTPSIILNFFCSFNISFTSCPHWF